MPWRASGYWPSSSCSRAVSPRLSAAQIGAGGDERRMLRIDRFELDLRDRRAFERVSQRHGLGASLPAHDGFRRLHRMPLHLDRGAISCLLSASSRPRRARYGDLYAGLDGRLDRAHHHLQRRGLPDRERSAHCVPQLRGAVLRLERNDPRRLRERRQLQLLPSRATFRRRPCATTATSRRITRGTTTSTWSAPWRKVYPGEQHISWTYKLYQEIPGKLLNARVKFDSSVLHFDSISAGPDLLGGTVSAVRGTRYGHRHAPVVESVSAGRHSSRTSSFSISASSTGTTISTPRSTCSTPTGSTGAERSSIRPISSAGGSRCRTIR